MHVRFMVTSDLLCTLVSSVGYFSAAISYLTLHCKTSSSAIAERPRCRVVQLWPKVEDWNWETIFTDNIGLYFMTYFRRLCFATVSGVL